MSLNSKMTDEAATSLAKSTDKNHDQMIDFDEFAIAMVKLAPNTKYDDDELTDCFRAFDTNHDGKISQSELDKVMRKLGEELSKQDIKDMMAEADANKDGYIDFEEFKRLLG
ncbi:calmodulin [Absidia repens]|uniref:Calmodulin n=1 Tax=Absidia repens TaxID=90262 RepID=A0A1X2ILD5_9FUNG|nr:calmodulin [Absidia repens]